MLGLQPPALNGVASIPESDRRGGDVILQLCDVVRTYNVGGEVVRALDGVTLTVQRGEFMAIMGRSAPGSRRCSTSSGCLDRPTSGTIFLDGVDVTRLPKSQLPRIRREKIGFVFQSFNLIPTLTALENVMLPMEYAGLPEGQRREQALAALDVVGLADRVRHRPSELSGGQAQRVVNRPGARAHPAIILADEPTGALDTQIARAIIQLMRDFNRERRQTFILVTHDPLVAEQTDRIVRLSDGRIASDTPRQRSEATVEPGVGAIAMMQILRNMARRWVRTGLTVFGIAIGVFALTVMGAMSENFANLLDSAERLASRNIQIQPATRSIDDRIDRTTIAHLKQVDGVEAVVTTLGGILADDNTDVSFGPPNQVYGIDPVYIPDVLGSVQLQAGRWLDESDFRATVVGSKVAVSYNLGIGSTLTWRKNDYTVVGIMSETDTFPDNFAVMPEDTVRRDLKLPADVIGSLTVIPEPGLDPEVVANRINDEVSKVRAQSPLAVRRANSAKPRSV